MRRLFSVAIFILSIAHLDAQNIQMSILDSINNVTLLTSDYVSFCTSGLFHSKSDERHSLALNYYTNRGDNYYILCLPIVDSEKLEVAKGNRLRLALQNNDTITLRSSTNFFSNDTFTENDSTLWVVLPKYHMTERVLRTLMDEKVIAFIQELPNGRKIKVEGLNFRSWKFSKTLNTLFKEINKRKEESAGADILFNNGRYKYVQSDTIIATDKKINFSDEWMY